MTTMTVLPILPGHLGGQLVQLIDARRLHDFLGVGRDFSNWIKGRIQEYGFEENIDYVVSLRREQACRFDSPNWANQTSVFDPCGEEPFNDSPIGVIADSTTPVKERGRGGDQRSIDYFLTLDMAKELAMVERSARGREARRYFIACERQLRQLLEGLAATPAVPARLSRAERQAINRQAWAEVAGEVYQAFHARRELLIQEDAEAKDSEPVLLPQGFRPPWAR